MACVLNITRLKSLVIVCLFIFCAAAAVNAQGENTTDYFDPDTWLLGDFSYSSLLNEPHDSWFDSEFNDYNIDDQAFIEIDRKGLGDIDIVVVLGTWCSDSRREVPRFMKIIESLQYDKKRMRFIGVDSYKEAPVQDYESLNIERVPTFIFYNNKNELGRIIEYPVASLEMDMLQILNNKK
ncbi:MAG TPA: thiol reductase thioredoxin [Bacteroidales bacterium]|nr:thiol reductase thioredoxin [Bacteroidales bacterium]